ncbi:MAG: ribonuclease HI [bacterium]|jgi:ribonuclease HI|nr:ribonuclease HI [Phycisphaerales bacterium]
MTSRSHSPLGDDLPRVQLYTDGACSGNPGPGGWAYLLRHPATGKFREESGGEALTTNNKMELTAVIRGLSALKSPSIVELHSDSKYVLEGLETWLDGWKKKGWRNSAKQPVKNAELWQHLDQLRVMHRISFHWIPGHAGHPENERCDMLAVAAARQFMG